MTSGGDHADEGRDKPGELTDDQRRVFEQIGAPTTVDPGLEDRQRRAAAESLAALRQASLTIAEFVAATGLDTEAVMDRIDRRSLWAFDGLVPRWELHDGAPLRGLDVVVPKIPASTRPTAVN